MYITYIRRIRVIDIRHRMSYSAKFKTSCSLSDSGIVSAKNERGRPVNSDVESVSPADYSS